MAYLTTAERLYPFKIMLDLPVDHLTSKTRAWIEHQGQETARRGSDGGSILDVGTLPFGWYMRVRADIADRIPSDLNDCMQKAHALGAYAILFDLEGVLSPVTGDLPVYDHNADDAVIAREDYAGLQMDPDGPATGVIAVDVLVTVATDDEAHIPCEPHVFGNDRLSDASYRATLKRHWDETPPTDPETDEPLPFPEGEDTDTIHDALAEHHGTSFGQYKLSTDYVSLADILTRGRPDPEPVDRTAPVSTDAAGPSTSDTALPRILATFRPQAWINDYATTVDPEGETTWDVTEEVLALSRDAALAIRDDQDESDEFRFSKNAPAWVRDWGGPFVVEVEDAIRQYYDAVDETATKIAA